MKNQEIILGIALVAIILVAAYALITGQPAENPDIELLKKSASSTIGHSDYLYSYEETQDGYTVTYVLLKKDGEKMITISNPFADKTIYFLNDDTILCQDFAGLNVCTSVKDSTESAFVSYLYSLELKFLDDSAAEEEIEKLGYFYEKGYLKFLGTTEKTVDGKPCREITYRLDFSNLSLTDANKYNIPLSSPQKFDITVCIDEDTGLAYSRQLSYYYNGEKVESVFRLLDADWNTSQSITPPAELSPGAYEALIEEKTWFAKYQACKEEYKDDARANCVSDIGTILKSKKVCELAEGWKDRCLLTVVSLTGDGEICPEIDDMSYRDDCYIELAYYNRDETDCAPILNVSKKEICIEAATSAPPSSNETIEIPNPAAVNCHEKGHDYEIRMDNETGGEYGVCMEDGLECEEWALYRGECCITDEDCGRDMCADQVCVAGNQTVDIDDFINYIDPQGEENETVSNETNSTESP